MSEIKEFMVQFTATFTATSLAQASSIAKTLEESSFAIDSDQYSIDIQANKSFSCSDDD